ncbi:MAG TPA: hypothetical protein VG797_08865 [Phycisphaerales bacterium]|nr:hypothetical protein [Phycisphaerales bacterium]
MSRPSSSLLRALRVSAVNVFSFSLCVLCASAVNASDFADRVISYSPAPGQFINNPAYNDPSRALGPPLGGGTLSADNTKVVSLGGFAGSIILGFDHTVLDDPRNPFGLDCIVFGNAFWVGGNANRRWAEGTVIEISRDANGNGLVDDPWFIIPGSHLTIPPDNSHQSQAWDDNPSTPTPPANPAWYPSAIFYPGFPSSYSTMGFLLPALFNTQVLQNPNGLAAMREGIWGYADCSPTLLLGDTNADNIVDHPSITAAEFFTNPDNPFAVGITPNTGGGDAFDIRWAIDPATSLPAHLDGFDFIRLSTGVNFIAGPVGEISTEVSGVSDVRPRESFFDLTGDSIATVEDAYAYESFVASASSAADLNGDAVIDSRDRELLLRCIRRSEPVDIATP